MPRTVQYSEEITVQTGIAKCLLENKHERVYFGRDEQKPLWLSYGQLYSIGRFIFPFITRPFQNFRIETKSTCMHIRLKVPHLSHKTLTYLSENACI